MQTHIGVFLPQNAKNAHLMLKLFFPHFFDSGLDDLLPKINQIQASFLILLHICKRLTSKDRECQLLLIPLVEMLGKLNLIFLLQFYIILNKVIGPIFGSLTTFLIPSMEFRLIDQSH